MTVCSLFLFGKICEMSEITNWFIECLEKRNSKGFLVDYTNPNLPAALAIHLAYQTRRPVFALSNSTDIFIEKRSKKIEVNTKDEFLIAAEMAKQAANKSLLAVSWYDKVEFNMLRPWSHFTLIADLFPLTDMYCNDISKMFYELNLSNSESIYLKDPQMNSTYKNNVTREEMIWVFNTNLKYTWPDGGGIIYSKQDPAKFKNWFSFTMRQKEIISKLHQHHKLTNHKIVRGLHFNA